MSTEVKRHILLVAGWYPHPTKSLHHGIFIQRHAKAIASLHQVTVIAFVASDGERIEEVVHHPNFKEVYFHYPKPTSRSQLFNTLRTFRWLNACFQTQIQTLVKKEKVELIHQHIAFPLGFFASRLAKKLNLPFVISEQWSGYLPEDNAYENLIPNYFTKRSFRNVKAVSAVSQTLANAIVSKGLTDEVSVIPNLIDAVFTNAHPAKRNNPIPRLIHVSSLNDREKNITCLIQALALVRQAQVDFRCSIVGDSQERSYFEHLVKQLNLEEQISFLGTRTPAQLVGLYAESDFMLLTSNYETFGVVIVEALASGLPVVASRAGAIPELVNTSNGILFEVGNAAAAKEAILEMIQHISRYSSQEIAASVSTTYSVQTIAQHFSKLYTQAMHE